MNLSLMELWTQMGMFAKGIVLVLAIMSIWSLTIMIQKAWSIKKAQNETKKFAPEFSQFLEEDNLTEAINLAQGYKKSHVARVLGNALSEVKPLIMDGSVTVADINSAERAVEREMLMTIVDLKRGLGVLDIRALVFDLGLKNCRVELGDHLPALDLRIEVGSEPGESARYLRADLNRCDRLDSTGCCHVDLDRPPVDLAGYIIASSSLPAP